MSKNKRNEDIIRIIRGRKIANQDELLEELKAIGHELTQATLSRNLKELGVGRIPDSEKGYAYIAPSPPSQPDGAGISISISSQSVVSFDYSYNLGVLRTIPGFANSVAMLIDSLNFKEIAGTIAGDDTILIIPREPFGRDDLLRAIRKALPEAL